MGNAWKAEKAYPYPISSRFCASLKIISPNSVELLLT